MPRHLIHCVDILQGWGVPAAAIEVERAAAYLRASRAWYELALTPSPESRERVLELWKEAPEQRDRLAPLVYGYPCPEFKRPFYRHAERGGVGSFRAWFSFDPSLRGYLHEFVVRAALDTADRERALDASITWARHFNGGREAWRAAANVIGGPREAPAGEFEWWEEALHERHRLTPVEYRRLFYFRATDTWAERHLSYPEAEAARDTHARPLGLALRRAALASVRLAGKTWGEEDVETYALALALLEGSRRLGWRPTHAVLRQIEEHSQRLIE